MELLVQRDSSVKGATLGTLSINGKFECYTLEDTVREIPGCSVAEWKIQNETAIPQGTYTVILSVSNRFKMILPEVLNVPGFTGIRIHVGNYAKNTDGCLLVGTGKTDLPMITNSKVAFDALFNKLNVVFKAKELIRITYKNKFVKIA